MAGESAGINSVTSDGGLLCQSSLVLMLVPLPSKISSLGLANALLMPNAVRLGPIPRPCPTTPRQRQHWIEKRRRNGKTAEARSNRTQDDATASEIDEAADESVVSGAGASAGRNVEQPRCSRHCNIHHTFARQTGRVSDGAVSVAVSEPWSD